MLEHIKSSTRDFLFLQCAEQRLLIDDRSACRVDDKRGRLHQSELLVRDHVPRFVIERRMQRDEIGLSQEPVKRDVFDTKLAFGVVFTPGAPVDDFHPEAARTPRGGLANAARTHETESLTVHKAAGEVIRLRTRELSGPQ